MGYDVHITRKALWFEDEGPAITLEEWLKYVQSDPEMRLDGYAEAEVRGEGVVLRVESPGMAVCAAYTGHGVNGNMAWFDHDRDNIVVKNPNQEILAKMWRIAMALDAKVQGDEGEVYDADGNQMESPKRPPAIEHDAGPSNDSDAQGL